MLPRVLSIKIWKSQCFCWWVRTGRNHCWCFRFLLCTTDIKYAIGSFGFRPRDVTICFLNLDAKALYNPGEKKMGTDENTFIRIFSERSRAHLAVVGSAYHSMYGKSLKKVVKRETSGLFEFGLLTILRCSQNPGKYFAMVIFYIRLSVLLVAAFTQKFISDFKVKSNVFFTAIPSNWGLVCVIFSVAS